MIYLDNASTTKPSKAAVAAFSEACENFGNPSSLHRLGLAAEKIINSAKDAVGEALSVPPKSVFFTSGGTESNNTVIFGYCRANAKRGRHIITTCVEHPSVSEPIARLEEEGFSVTRLGVDSFGRINLRELEEALCEDTIFVSIMAANNEVGTIMPIEEIKQIMKRKSPLAALHVDAVQAFGKIPLSPLKYGVDFMSLSSHKIHGVKGTGAIYMANEHIKPIIIGGGQQKALRSGTENVPGIAAFAAAVREICTDNREMKKTRLLFKEKLSREIENIDFNGSDEYQTGYILNASFKGIKAEILLHMLENKDIYVSTGSACSSNKPMPSKVLTAMGCSAENITGAVRFSFSKPISESDIERVSKETADAVAEIRKYIR